MSHIAVTGGNKRLAQAVTAQNYRAAQPKVPQIGLHTSESPAGQPLAALWGFLDSRTTHGSYNGGADVYGTKGQYAPWSWYTWHAPSINPWACGLAANCQADQWDRMADRWRENLIDGLAWLAHQYSRWCVGQGLGPVPAKRITPAQALRREPGFVYHGDLQSDRTDPTGPRNVFPLDDLLAKFIKYEAASILEEAEAMDPKSTWEHRDTNGDFTKSHQLNQARTQAIAANNQTKPGALRNTVFGYQVPTPHLSRASLSFAFIAADNNRILRELLEIERAREAAELKRDEWFEKLDGRLEGMAADVRRVADSERQQVRVDAGEIVDVIAERLQRDADAEGEEVTD